MPSSQALTHHWQHYVAAGVQLRRKEQGRGIEDERFMREDRWCEPYLLSVDAPCAPRLKYLHSSICLMPAPPPRRNPATRVGVLIVRPLPPPSPFRSLSVSVPNYPFG